MASPSSIATSALIPGATIGTRPLDQVQVAIPCCELANIMCSLARFWRWEDNIAKSATNESHSYEFDIRAEGRRQNDAEDVGWKCEEERRWRSKRWRQIVCGIVSNLITRRRRRGRSGER